jgi:predicted PP-loop superfamily ATPase
LVTASPKLDSKFKIQIIEKAVHAIDRKPKIAMVLCGDQIPFGCHGINKPKVIDFGNQY